MGFGRGCASRWRWETPGSGDRWPSTFSWRSVDLGCHHNAFRRAVEEDGAVLRAVRRREERTFPEVTGRFGLLGGRWSEEANNFLLHLAEAKVPESPQPLQKSACAAKAKVRESPCRCRRPSVRHQSWNREGGTGVMGQLNSFTLRSDK